MGYVYLTIAIVGELVGTTYLKYSEGYTKFWPSVISIVSYVICFYTFSKVLLKINLSVSYATWSAIGIIVLSFISVFIMKEQITPIGVASLAMITVGVVLLNLYGTPA